MLRLKHSVLLFVLFLIAFPLISNPVPKGNKGTNKGIRISLGPVIGFYKINRNHARKPAQKVSALFSFKKEIRFGRDYKTFFHYGVEYFFHGLTFSSYYFKPDSLQLYDKVFAYKYSLFMQEINVPLQFKYSFTRENNSLFTSYLMVGYHLRYFFPGNLKVTKDGSLIKEDNVDMNFKTKLLVNQMNSFLSITFGSQKNNTASSKSGLFIELSYRYGFSPYSFQTSYSASSLFITGNHLSLLVGVKF